MSRKQYLIWLLPIIWLVVTIYLTFQNGDSSGKLSHIIAEKICVIFNSSRSAHDCEVIIRELAHFGIHFVLAFLTSLAAYYGREDPFRPAIATLIVCTIVAITDEIGQLFIAGRFFEFFDIIENMLGIIYGTMCFVLCKGVAMHIRAARN